jgi:hypothetical protein
MASRLTDILQQEYKTRGLIGGTASAFGKSSREKMDIRNVLFGGSGLGSIVGRKVFGKGYSAIDRSNKSSEMSSAISGSSSVLQEISINSRITAKNSMALPAMASQMNIMQKNIAKLVKLQGGTPSTKAQSYFSSAKFRENAYEATFNKNAKGTTPTMVSKEKGSGLTGILGLVSSLFVGLASKLGSFGSIIAGLVGTFAVLGTVLMGTVKLIMGIISMLPGGKLLVKGLKLGALATGGLFAANALSKGNDGTDISGQSNQRGFLDRAGQAAGGIGGAALAYGGLKAGSALGNRGPQYEMRQSTIAEKGGKIVKAGDVGSKSMGERLEKLRKFAVKISSKKQNTLFFKLLGERVGKAVAFKAVTMFASFAAAPFTAGFSLLITIASAILLGYEIIQIYDAIFGKDGIETALDAMDKAKKTSDSATAPEAMSFEDALIGAFAEALGLNQPTPTSPTPATPSLPKAGTPEAISKVSSLGGQQQTYASMGGGEFGPDMLAATGVNADQVDNASSTSPTRTDGGDMANLIRTKFKAAGFSDAQAEGAVANARAESSLNPNAFNGRGGEESVGLFQMNRKGGLGKGHSIENLKDPNYNIDLAIAAAKKAPRFQAAKTAEEATKAFMLEVERPKDQSASAQAKRVALLNNTGEKIGKASSDAAAANRTPASSSGGNQTTNVISGGSGNQSVALGSAANPYDTELARFLTGIMATQ